ncbi:TonB-dependent receptor plug domain-containing protein [Aurantibacter crassamenti]|uniref:TonB-dependent receptor n=1 Tax=Aurantibacter crassamenti TaxID=1837375 RepID=UPI001939D1F7|nr:carboxypeptidase-like regulatory domain-containing protein [Aurantibacter crassamenti]MBM1106150.1 TonB-dependent receptor plug domain-containing protein [Aurantibacter crassamenti]
MPKTCRNYSIGRLLALLALLFVQFAIGQEVAASKVYLTTYLQKLENQFNIKFSYADANIQSVEIIEPTEINLGPILKSLQNQTQISIQKLNERYYALRRSSLIDICATVLDNFEQNTVMGATVEVLENNQTTVTDLEGNFAFTNIPRTAVLQIKHIGFKTLFVTAEELMNQQECTKLLLAVTYQQLEEVVVYKFLTTGIKRQFDASININPVKFGILPGQIEPDVLQTIQALPGIKSIDETVSDINIRGGTNDQNLILWNGIKMYQSGHFFGLISAFNPYLTDKVNVIKNGSSAAYGGGVSGIIDMHTINRIEEQFTGGAGINLINADVFGQLPISDKLAIQFSARRSLTDFFDTGTYGRFRDRVFQDSDAIESDENFYFYDFTAKVIYDINENQKLRFSLINTNNRLDYSETNNMNTTNTNSVLDQYNLSFGANLESKWTDKFTTNLNIYQSQYKLNARNTAINNGMQQLLQNNKVLENTLKLESKYKLKSNVLWSNGYEFNETGILNETFVNQPLFESSILDVLEKHALFSEVTFSSKDKKCFTNVGARINYFNNIDTFSETIIEPRLNMNYSFANNFKIEVQGEFKSQAINQVIDLEQNFFGIEKRRWILSDGTTLPVTKSKQGSIGLNYDEENLYVGLEAFYKQVDGISTSTQGFQNQNQFNGQLGKYDIKGAEFLINKRAQDYSAWLSYTYNINDYTFDGVVPPKFPNNLDVRHNLTLAGSYTLHNLKMSLGINYRSGKPFTQPDADNPIDSTFFPASINYQPANSNRLPTYFRADASAIYNFKSNRNFKSSLGISVINFTNRLNVLDSYYRIDDAGEIETIKSTSLGLTPNLNFRISF